MNDERANFGHIADKVKDTMGGIQGIIKAKVVESHVSDAFVKSVAIGDMYEIEAAKMALQRSRNDVIKQMAKKMIHDHITNSHQLHSALRMNETRGIDLPPEKMDNRREEMVKHLQEAPEDAFDDMYLDQQILAHKETLALMEGYRDSGDNPQLRSFAAGAAPVVKRHLKHMKALKDAKR